MHDQILTDEYWADDAQLLLVRAALAEGEPARQAWMQWLAANDMDQLDDSSFHIIPQLYRNLERHNVTGAEMGRLRGIYRYAWARNQLARRSLVMFLERLAQERIECVLMKGMALLLETYRDMGGRQMQDIDVLLRDKDLPRAGAILQEMGYRFIHPLPTLSLTPFIHAVESRHPHWTDLDLHVHPLLVDCPQRAETDIWQRTSPIEVDGAAARVPEVTDQLLIVLSHSRKRDRHARCRWMADTAAMIRDRTRPVDFDALVDRSRQCQVWPPIRDALLFLAGTVDGIVPEAVVAQLQAAPVGPRDLKRYYQLRHESDERRSLRALLTTHLWRYRGGCRSRGRTPTPWGFVHYVLLHYQRIWELKSPARVPWHIVVEIGRSLRGTCRDDIAPRQDTGAA